MTLGTALTITALAASVGDQRVTRSGVALYLSAGIGLMALGLLGMLDFLPSTMVRPSWFAVGGIVIILQATGRLFTPPADRTTWPWVVLGVFLMVAAVAYGLPAYRY